MSHDTQLYAAAVRIAHRGHQLLTTTRYNKEHAERAAADLSQMIQEIWEALDDEWMNETDHDERPKNEDDYEAAIIEWHQMRIDEARQREARAKAAHKRQAPC